jgi:Phage integrase, N-terminal SAM-like domain
MVISSTVQHVNDVEETVHVQPVVLPGSGVESWTVVGDDDAPVEPIERYLAYLSDIDRSPNTVKAYAHDLKDYWVFLTLHGLDWREVRLEDVGEYVAWLRLPPAGRGGAVAVLPSVQAHVGASTINRKLSALSAFYQHQARHGVDVGELLTTWGPPGRRSGWKPFLHHVGKGKPQARRAIAVKVSTKLPRVLAVDEFRPSWMPAPGYGTVSCSLCFMTAAFVLVRPWACGTRTSSPRSGRSGSCRGSTPTVPGRSPDASAASRSARD